mmetsp:Transcript_9089/g.28174  ORF Transcript_9089/g.28174 Transcript_9089/m.28174 type:complete len:346 (+) Transcript_9089:897-1934(+)
MIFTWATATTFTDLHRDRAGDHITRCQILCSRSISFHEWFTFRVQQFSTLTTRALCNQATSSIDTGRMELDKLEILHRETGTACHCITVTSTSMSRSARKVSTTVATGSKYSVLGTETVNFTRFHCECDHTTALTVFHDQIQHKVLNKEFTVVFKCRSIERVQKSVTCAISSSTAAGRHGTLAKVQTLTTERTLVDFAVLCTGERNTIVLKFVDSSGSLTAHILNCILITKPITAFHRIICMPAPVIFTHVSQSSIDTTLCSYRMRASREQFADASSLETFLGKAESSTQTTTTRTDYQCIIGVIHNRVVPAEGAGLLHLTRRRRRTSMETGSNCDLSGCTAKRR